MISPWVPSAALAAALLFLQRSVPDSSTAPTLDAPVVVEHRGDLDLRDQLILDMEVWHDAGDFLVGAAPDAILRALERRGVRATRLAPLQAGEELHLLVADSDGAAGRVLHRSAAQILVALPGAAEATGHAPCARGFHGGRVRIVPRAMQPAPIFTWRGRAGGDGVAALGSTDPRIQAIVNDVNLQNLDATVQSLSALFTRRATSPEAVTAQNMIQAQLQGLGLSTSLQSFGAQYSQNVIATLPGTVHPEKIIVIGGHYDSINLAGSSQTAPGADDNASGTAGVIEAARVLTAGGPYENTLRFILFSGEEFGLLGSAAAAGASQAAGEDILAMLNTDMSSFRVPGDARDVDFVTNNSSASLIAFCRSVGTLYVPGWADTQGSLSAGTSDHQSYFSRGFPAAFLFEDLTQYYRFIHTAADDYPQANTDFELAKMIVQGIVAAAATLAEPACQPAPANYCIGAPNSTGFGASMGFSGSQSIGTNDVNFLVAGCPPNKFGFFVWSSTPDQAPLANGFRCFGTPFIRFPGIYADASGDASYHPDLNALPQGTTVSPGDVKYVQFYYRDPPAGGANANLSDGLSLTFCP